jgi:hypothetical protein
MAITKLSDSSITTGDKYISMLAGNTAFSPSSYESIATVTVGSGGSASVSFSSISSDYTHLQLRGITANSVSGDSSSGVLISLNSDTTAGNYKSHALYGDGSSVTASSSTRTLGLSGSTSGYNTYVIDILDYKNTNKYKTVRSLSGFDQNGYGFVWFGSVLWMNTNAVTAITLTPGANNFLQYSQIGLYGVKA